MTDVSEQVLDTFSSLEPDLESLYRQLHEHPELAFQEEATAAEVSRRLTDYGFEVTTGVAGTGVVGVLRSGDGPTVMLRADMDALPGSEETGLPYASAATAVDADGETVPVMHACGHDMHVACLLGACGVLASSTATWQGTVVAVFQPGEESGYGARRLVDDGLFERFPKPDIILGQHVAPAPAGIIAHCPETILGATDSLKVRLFGRGGHGSRPEATVDPVVMAASLVLRLQTIVSRQLSPSTPAVVTVGKLHAGTLGSVIPSHADLEINVRTFTEPVREQVLAAIKRCVAAEAAAAGAPQEPEIVHVYALPATYNDPEATEKVSAAHGQQFGPNFVIRIPTSSASEDFGILGTAAGVPSVFWFFGGTEPAKYMAALAAGRVDDDIPFNHSPAYAPLIQPTLKMGMAALVSAATAWLAPVEVASEAAT